MYELNLCCFDRNSFHEKSQIRNYYSSKRRKMLISGSDISRHLHYHGVEPARDFIEQTTWEQCLLYMQIRINVQFEILIILLWSLVVTTESYCLKPAAEITWEHINFVTLSYYNVCRKFSLFVSTVHSILPFKSNFRDIISVWWSKNYFFIKRLLL